MCQSIKTLEDCQRVAKEKNGECLSKTYKNQHTKIEWQCSEGHVWSAVPMAIRTGSWCPYCSPRPPLTISDACILAQSKQGLCIDTTYVNSETLMTWQCEYGHQWQNTYAHIKHGQWCPYCAKGINSTENKVRRIFETIFNYAFPAMRPDFLKDSTTNRKLELDGYCKELRLAFEYDGRMHYEERSTHQLTDKQVRRHSCLSQIQEKDKIKDALCKTNHIVLIRIPYWENNNLEVFIRNQLQEKGVIDG